MVKLELAFHVQRGPVFGLWSLLAVGVLSRKAGGLQVLDDPAAVAIRRRVLKAASLILWNCI